MKNKFKEYNSFNLSDINKEVLALNGMPRTCLQKA